MTTFRKGDVCTIQVVVESVYGIGIRIRHVDSYTDIHVKPKDLTMVRPQFEVGDLVEWGSSKTLFCGEILSIAEDHAWISRGDGEYATVWLPNLRRLDPEPAAVTATESTYVAMEVAMSATEDPDPIPDLEPRVPRFDGGEDRSGEVE